MTGCDIEELLYALLESFRILLPQQVVEKYAHGVHAELLRPTQLQVDAPRIKSVRLPHLELIDGVVWDVVAAQRPGLLRVPGVRLFRRPPFRLGRLSCTETKAQH